MTIATPPSVGDRENPIGGPTPGLERPVRLLHIIPSLDQSGAEKQLALAALHLPKDRYQLKVIATTRGGHFEELLRDANVDVEVIGKRLKWDPFTLHRLYQAVSQFKPDIVHTWMFAGNAYGRVAARWAGVPHVVASERCVDEWKSGYHFMIDRWLMRWTDRVAVNAEAIRRFYTQQGVAGERIVTIPNAVELAPAGTVADRRRLRQTFGLPPEIPVIGFVGRLWPQKRVQDLIWAADILRMSGWKFHLLIVGDGPRRTALEKFADALDIQSIVHFLGHRDDASEIMRGLDMLVLPSKFEGLPNVVLEAMMAKRPVVATQIAGVDEVVVDQETGILVPPKQPLEIARGIRRLLVEPGWGEALGERGRQRVLEHFSIERMLAAYESLYAELMAN